MPSLIGRVKLENEADDPVADSRMGDSSGRLMSLGRHVTSGCQSVSR